jgi:hypothetical protein
MSGQTALSRTPRLVRGSELYECFDIRYDLHSLIGGAIGFRTIRDCLRFAITLSLHLLVANQQV